MNGNIHNLLLKHPNPLPVVSEYGTIDPLQVFYAKKVAIHIYETGEILPNMGLASFYLESLRGSDLSSIIFQQCVFEYIMEAMLACDNVSPSSGWCITSSFAWHNTLYGSSFWAGCAAGYHRVIMRDVIDPAFTEWRQQANRQYISALNSIKDSITALPLTDDSILETGL